MSDCKHLNCSAEVAVTRLEDSGRFSADVRVKCADCQLPFQFLGLPCGLDLDCVGMSFDGQEARLAIAPSGTVPPPFAGATGFKVTKRG